VDSITNALLTRMVGTYSVFWPRRLLHKRRPLRKYQPPTGQECFKTGKLDWLECQTGPSDFPEVNNKLWSAIEAAGA
jgi:hypothetical protein